MIITGKFHNEHLICNSMERLYLYKNSTQINAQMQSAVASGR